MWCIIYSTNRSYHSHTVYMYICQNYIICFCLHVLFRHRNFEFSFVFEMNKHINSEYLNGIKVSVDDFGFDENSTNGNASVKIFTFETENFMTVEIITYGAIIKGIKVPNRMGKVDDILLGYDTLQQYKNERCPKLGCVLDFNNYNHAVNNNMGDGHLSLVNWKYYLKHSTLTLTHLNKTILYTIVFEILVENSINISIVAKSDAVHFVNLSPNLFFNLSGHGATRDHLYRHRIVLNAEKYLVPNGGDVKSSISKCLRGVGGTGYDLRIPHHIGSLIAKSDTFGYNHSFILTRDLADNSLSFNCRISDRASGRSLEIFSNGFAARLCTANGWPNTHKNHVFYDEYGTSRSNEQLIANDDGNLSAAGSDILSDISGQYLDAADQPLSSGEISRSCSEISSVCCDECRDSALPINESIASLNSAISSVCCIDCQKANGSQDITLQIQNGKNNGKSEGLTQKLWQKHKQNQCNGCTYCDQHDFNNVSGKSDTNIRTANKPATITAHSIACTSSISTISTVQCYGCKQIEYRNEIRGKGKSIYRMHDAICVNVLQYPDEVCCSEFSKRCTKPDRSDVHQILYRFKSTD